jgi:hypothetical protein
MDHLCKTIILTELHGTRREAGVTFSQEILFRFMETEILLLRSQEPTTGPYLEKSECSPHSQSVSLKLIFLL